MTGTVLQRKTAPVDRIERWAIGKLTPYAQNPRLHSREQVDLIAASMRDHGQTQLIVVDEAGEIIAGHGRILGAEQIGLKTVMVGIAAGWSEAEKRAYRIKDNQLALSSTWDTQLLSAEVGILRTDEYDLSLLGFGADELALLTADPLPAGADPEAVPEPPKVPIVKLGDLWVLGKHRLLCGDATKAEDVARVLDGVHPHLMVTDPPYGVNYDPKWRAAAGINNNRGKLGEVVNDHRADWREAWALFPGDVAYVWHGGLHTVLVAESLNASGFDVRQQIIWAKDRFALSRGHYHWQHEPCWYVVREKGTGHWAGDRKQSTLWNIQARDDAGHGHSTQKPVECMKRPIENNSSPGQAVYDPFVGSGTTIIAAEMTARCCYGIDIDPVYVEVAMRRWEQFTGKTAVLSSG